MQLKGFCDGKEHDVLVVPVEGGYDVTVDGVTRRIDCVRLEASFYSLILAGRSYEVSVRFDGRGNYAVRHGGYLKQVKLLDPLAAAAGANLSAKGPVTVTAMMPGRVVKVLVEAGNEVAEGDPLIVLEAMKMENEVAAPRAGKVARLLVEAGQTLENGAKIAVIE